MFDFLIKFLKRKYWGSEFKIENFTPDFIAKQRLSMNMTGYRKWLRYHYTLFSARALERKEREMPILKLWVDRLNSIEKELEDIEVKLGIPQGRKRISEELRSYKKIMQ